MISNSAFGCLLGRPSQVYYYSLWNTSHGDSGQGCVCRKQWKRRLGFRANPFKSVPKVVQNGPLGAAWGPPGSLVGAFRVPSEPNLPPWGLQGTPRAPQVGPRSPKLAHSWTQVGPKLTPSWPKMSKLARNWPKLARRSGKEAQLGSK